MSGVRAFVSFDVHHDSDLGKKLSAESRHGGSGFTLAGQSTGGEVTEHWCESVREQIRDADRVIVICGEHTADALAVNEELRIAQEEEKPYILLWGRRELMCTMPTRAKRSEFMYSWTRETLCEQLSSKLGNARPLGGRKRT